MPSFFIRLLVASREPRIFSWMVLAGIFLLALFCSLAIFAFDHRHVLGLAAQTERGSLSAEITYLVLAGLVIAFATMMAISLLLLCSIVLGKIVCKIHKDIEWQFDQHKEVGLPIVMEKQFRWIAFWHKSIRLPQKEPARGKI